MFTQYVMQIMIDINVYQSQIFNIKDLKQYTNLQDDKQNIRQSAPGLTLAYTVCEIAATAEILIQASPHQGAQVIPQVVGQNPYFCHKQTTY